MSYSYIDSYKLIDNLSNFKKTNSSNSYNEDSRCTYIAGAMVLYYSKYFYNQNFTPDNYIETYQGVRRFTFELTQHLLDIGKSLGYDEALLSAYDIQNIMKTYCESEGIFVDRYAMALSTPINIDLCILNNKPMVLMGYFKDPYTGKKATHSVCCYGLATMPLGFGQTQRFLLLTTVGLLLQVMIIHMYYY